MSDSGRGMFRCAIRVWVAGVALLFLSPASALQDVPTRAVVIEATDTSSAAHRAGILPGDVFTSWELVVPVPQGTPSVAGQLASPFDLEDVEIEQAPRGTVTLRGYRGDRELAVPIPQGRWRLQARPSLTPETLDRHAAARRAASAGRIDEAVAAWKMAARTAEDEAASAWLLMQAAVVLREARRIDDAHGAINEALSAAERTGARAAIASVQEMRAQIYERQNDLAKVEEVYRAVGATRSAGGAPGLGAAKALVDVASLYINRENLRGAEPLLREAVEIQRRLAPGSIVLARSLTSLGNVLRANPSEAEPLLREAAGILERQVPDTADFAVALNNLGNLLWPRGTLDQAADSFRRALAILEQADPAGPDAAASLMGLGIVALSRGRLSEAEPYFRRSLALQQRLAPGTANEARVLANLGAVLLNRGSLQEAEELYVRALAIHERVAPQSQNVAQTLNNIGLIHEKRGDRVRAEDYLKRSLELKERLAPGGVGSATTLQALGNLARDRGDLQAAEAFLQRVLALRERQAPRGSGVATALNNLGNVALDRGDLVAARERYEKARALLEQAAPDGLEMAVVLDRLAAVAERRGDLADAERLAASAVAITGRIAPNSADHAFVLRRIARLARESGDLNRAAATFASVLDAVESQSQRLGGSSEARTAYAGQRRAIYLEYIDVLMALGQPARAFDVLERSRARAFLMMLAERDLVLDADLPADLKQSDRQLREDYDRLQESLTRLNPRQDAAEIDRVNERLRELRDKRRQLLEKVRSASPRFAALQHPQPLDLAQVQQALDPGTIMLSYQVGADASRLFVVRRSTGGNRETLAVHTLAIREPELREHVAAFLRLIERDAGAAEVAPAFMSAARGLYDLLVAPAEQKIAGADRVPDLAGRPSPQLAVRRADEEGRWRERPTRAVSGGVEAAAYGAFGDGLLRAEKGHAFVAGSEDARGLRRSGIPRTASGEVSVSNSELQRMTRRGYDLAPLPGTRAEVKNLARGFGKHATIYVGAEATEARAKAITKATYLHFATHGLLDARSPLDSALALTVPKERRMGEENGLLQAWEIFEQLRIDADLVTLSACETALGGDVAGEGLVGLTRAFHYAGAKTVLASLWRVDDDSTSSLMTRVYAHLKAGVAKDEALRRAQLEAIARSPTGPPFHWAAFTLSGDWQ